MVLEKVVYQSSVARDDVVVVDQVLSSWGTKRPGVHLEEEHRGKGVRQWT